MSGFKHLLPSSTFRAAVCVSVAVGTSLSGLGDEVVGCLAGLARVPAGVAVTNRFVPFRPDFASIFAVQMDGGTNRLDSDVVAWCPVGGEPVAFWKLELPGHGLDGWLVAGTSSDDAVPVAGRLASGDGLVVDRKPGSIRTDLVLGGLQPASAVPSNGWFRSAASTPPVFADLSFDVDAERVSAAVSNGTAGAVVLFSRDGAVAAEGWTLEAVLQPADGTASWTGPLPPVGGTRFYLAKDAADDTDGDGIPDVWEVEHGLDPLSPVDASADPDGDGLDNLFEYRQGLDPHAFDLDPRRARPGLVARGWFFSSGISSFACMDTAPPRDCFVFDMDINFPVSREPWAGFGPRYTDNFALSLKGWLRVDVPGAYVFHMASDDGSYLEIDGRRILDDSGAHVFRWRSATVELAAGWHPVALAYFEGWADAGWVLEWTPPDGARAVVPHANFAHLVEEETFPPNVVWTGPTTTYAPGNIVPLEVETWDFGSGVVRVDFLEGGTNLIASSTNAPHTVLWPSVPAGPRQVVAVARNAAGLSAAATGCVSVVSMPEEGYAYGLDAFYYRPAEPPVRIPEMPPALALVACVENDVSRPIGLRGLTQWPSDAVYNYASAYEGWLLVREPGEYEFSLGSDDGSRLILDGETVIDAPTGQILTARNALCALGAGFHRVRVEYFQKWGVAELWLKWRKPGDWTFSLVPPTRFFRTLGPSATADTDGDGMTDWWERNFGLNPFDPSDASLDPDGDGLTNREEFSHGTHPHRADTDGDGIPDDWEVAHGLNPLLRADGGHDLDGDGATNRQEYEAGTDIRVADTDGDGVPDGEEINARFSDPLAVDFDGTVRSVGRLAPKDATGGAGDWVRRAAELQLVGRAGRVDFTNGFALARGGVYRVRMRGVGEKSGDAVVRCLVDGVEIGTADLAAFSGTPSSACFYTPWLEAGRHAVSLDFRNVVNGFSFRVFEVEVDLPLGPDSDGDGVPDWVSTHLAWSRPDRQGTVASKVSPFCLTGRAVFPELVRVAGGTVRPLPDRGWWTDVALSDEGPVSVPCSFENGGRTEEVQVGWTAVDLAAEPDMTLRVGDALLLAGASAVQATGATNGLLAVEDRLVFRFPRAGVYRLMPYDAAGAPLRNAPMTVTAIAGTMPDHLPAWKGKISSLVLPELPRDGVSFRVDDDLGFDVSDAAGGGVRLALDCPVYQGARTVAVRIDNPDASVLCSSPVAGFTAYYTLDGVYHAIRRQADGTLVVLNRISGFDIPSDVVLKMRTQSGVCFADGSGELVISASSFNEIGDCYYRFFVPPEVTNPCQFLQAVWNERGIAQ